MERRLFNVVWQFIAMMIKYHTKSKGAILVMYIILTASKNMWKQHIWSFLAHILSFLAHIFTFSKMIKTPDTSWTIVDRQRDFFVRLLFSNLYCRRKKWNPLKKSYQSLDSFKQKHVFDVLESKYTETLLVGFLRIKRQDILMRFK